MPTLVRGDDQYLDGAALASLDAHWRAANYLAVGPDLPDVQSSADRAAAPEHIKPRLLGHWGTSPGLNLVHTHLNRVVRSAEPGRRSASGGPATAGRPCWRTPGWRAATPRPIPDITRDADGMARLFRQFSFPGGVPSHVAPETPGSIHEGGELGYSLAHAYGAAFDNPDLSSPA